MLAPPVATAPEPTPTQTPAPVVANPTGASPTGASPNNAHPTDAASGSDQKTESATTANSVVVAPGDSLWSITAQLNPTATTAQLSELWPQLYESNKQAIGSNPNLIIPGIELFIPASLSR